MNSKSKIITIISSIFLIAIIAFIAIRGGVFEIKQEILVKAFPANINDLFNEEYINLKKRNASRYSYCYRRASYFI